MFSFLGLAPHAFAAAGDFVALAPIPGLTQGVVANSAGLASFFNNLYKYLIGLAAVLAVIMIIWGGLEISTKDSVSKKQNGRERITQAILGLVLVLSPVLVFSIINPSILNLSIGLGRLNVASSSTLVTPGNVTSQCDSSSLTPTQQQACRTGLDARQQGVLNLTPAQREALTQAIPIIRQTDSDQTVTCTAGGGRVYRIANISTCTPGVCCNARREGYATCAVLISGSLCFSNQPISGLSNSSSVCAPRLPLTSTTNCPW